MKINTRKLDIELAKAGKNHSDLRQPGTISSTTLSKIRNVPDYNAPPKVVGAIARALGIPVEALLVDETA